ncbi:MAG: hypothetical protein U9P44_01075, partial [archaeon]|nr:hypothetical protein [archaeon]
YVAVDPVTAIDKSKNILEDNFKRTIDRMDVFSSSESIKELSDLYSSGVSLVDPSELSGSFKGNYATNLHLNTMFKGAENSINIITTSSGVKTLCDRHATLLQKAKNNKIKIRVIAPVTSDNRDDVSILSDIVEFRDSSSSKYKLPLGRMVVIDGKQVLFGLTDDSQIHESQDISFWSASSHFSENFAQTMFDMIWTNLK